MPNFFSRRQHYFEDRKDLYDIPLGDKVAFSLFRCDATPGNYTDDEREAIKIILEEQFRKRQQKKESELFYTRILSFKSEYKIIFCKLLVYFYIGAKTYEEHEKFLENISDNFFKGQEQEYKVRGYFVNLFTNNEQHLNKYKTAEFVSFIFCDIMTTTKIDINDSFWEAINKFIKQIEQAGTDLENDAKFKDIEAILTEAITYFFDSNKIHDQNNYIEFRFLYSGFNFQSVYDKLAAKNFSLKSLNENFSFLVTQNNECVIIICCDDKRFYSSLEVNGVQTYKKYRLPGDEPWKCREGLTEDDYLYVQDRRGNFVKRYTYRFIQPFERMFLAHSNIAIISAFYPRDWDASFYEVEGYLATNHDKKGFNKGLIKKDEVSENDIENAVHEEVGEFGLSRLGTFRYRLIATTHAGHKYDIRSNKDGIFLKDASSFEKYGGKGINWHWQGGGVIKIDLTLIDKEDIRCQYKSNS